MNNNIYCCKIGCTIKMGDNPQSQEIAYRTVNGSIIRSRIYWCTEHTPTCILDDFSNVDLLKNKGGGY